VVLLGDVVDQRNALLEASGPFMRGVELLRAAGIPVVAVVGNHDVEELPRLVDATDGIDLLGRAGTWQSLVVQRAGRPAVRLVGWSFPTSRVTTSPLDSLDPRMRAGTWGDGAGALPTLGLLHCDLDVPGSHHAPVRRTDLVSVPVDAWLLGHVHKPDALDEDRPVGYLGSVAPLDPGEPGWHGAWLAHCRAG